MIVATLLISTMMFSKVAMSFPIISISESNIHTRTFLNNSQESVNRELQLSPIAEKIPSADSFVTSTGLDCQKFEAQTETLEQTLIRIDDWMNQTYPSRRRAHQFIFAKRLFHAMLKASETLKGFERNTSGDFLVSKLIHLNIWCFSLYDSFGVLNTERKSFAFDLARSQRTLKYWETLFQDLYNVPSRVIGKFESELRLAKTHLYLMDRQSQR
ncbi:hypothetical protein JCM33374_g5154 [Metschnikowia sp. JCM 33374]|nr:hypothetical protein JCM33374_g5154 [Metschnikowia sp. JCM 33374]